ncbi:MAG: short-chain dehydrogenase [Pseudonocardiales bacterium]|nr:short-chain dehydrogenase [Pseudonocardiales bacterium]
MELNGSVVLVTGANRGLGRHFAQQLLERGAKVYAGARNPDSVDLPGAIPVRLDVTSPADVAAAALFASDVNLVINNAGSGTGASALTGSMEDIRLEMETHYFGTLAVSREFAPVLARNGGGGLLNVLSVLSWISFPAVGAYCAAKAASWSLTNALRSELAPAGTVVSALHVGYMDTDMTAGIDAPKLDPAFVAALALDGVAAGEFEILADDLSRQVQAGLAGGVAALYPQLFPATV